MSKILYQIPYFLSSILDNDFCLRFEDRVNEVGSNKAQTEPVDHNQQQSEIHW